MVVEFVVFGLMVFGLAFEKAALASAAAERPNVILILGDDMGWSDLGCYGGEIETPHLDQMAAQGMRFTQFYNNAKCTTTRASLLTGLYPRPRGDLLQTGMITLGEAVGQAGYQTALCGKWHLGRSETTHPCRRGFGEFYGLLDGCCNYFDPSIIDPPYKASRERYFAHNHERLREFPDDFYTTDAFTDHAIETLRRFHQAGQPFFLHLCYTAPHYPLHAKPHDIARYRGKYRQGWEALRKARFARQQELGLIDSSWTLSGTDSRAYPWTSADQEFEDLRMAVYAAMVDAMDQNIGRLLATLDELEIADNTVVLFLSDNGGCAEEPGGRDPAERHPGPKDDYVAVGPAWGWAQNAPFRRYKTWTHEGGICTPLVVRWPGHVAPGAITAQPGHIIDLMPTLLELAGSTYPANFDQREILPVEGKSLLPVLVGEERAPHDRLCWEWAGCAAIRQGNWKAVWDKLVKRWELYDLEHDRTETRDLAEQFPDRVTELAEAYDEWARHTHNQRVVTAEPRSSATKALPVSVPETRQPPELIKVAPGFHVEKIYNVPLEQQGSWVSLATDGQGGLVVSDQDSKGLYRVSIRAQDGPTEVEVTRLEGVARALSGAQGMVRVDDSLYVNCNPSPFVRLQDRDGDGVLDHVERLPSMEGAGEHGNHAVIRAADGERLMVAAGNHTDLPPLAASRVTTWEEDLLLPRQWDASGHARGRLAPGGWVCQFDPREKTYELYCIGFRNEYDLAFNSHGDLFTFDADMEWDFGLPWYRPTRICHVVSGGDYGWRSGSGKWPAYYEDSLPPVVDVGPGSPTGVTSGQGAAFPAEYQRALFALDWTFGTIYAVHLEPQGAGYTGRLEPFITGQPLPVTDAVVGQDGALYFTTGGRGMQSALYRVTYVGAESTAAVKPDDDNSHGEARRLRRQLEAFHGRVDPGAVAAAWPHAGSPDRFLRHAARVAIESQPTSLWADRVFEEPNPQTRITTAVALARRGQPEHRAPLLASLLGLEPGKLTSHQFLGLLRAYGLTFMRLGAPTPVEREAIIATLQPYFPSDNAALNLELVQVLVYLEKPDLASQVMDLIEQRRPPQIPDWKSLASRNSRYGKGIEQMLAHHPPTQELGYAFMLRNLKTGWTLDLRRRYFKFLNEAASASGGVSFAGFLANVRAEALAHCSDEERVALSDVTGVDFQPQLDFEVTPPQGPGRKWSLDEALAAVEGKRLKGQDFEAGRNVFFAASCGKCHRFAGLGGGVGPDLTSVVNRFDIRYILDTIIHPSKQISDQYATSLVHLKSGQILGGLVAREGDQVIVYTSDPAAEPVTVPQADVEKIEPSGVSQMPEGLLDVLSEDELRNLMAFLLSGANPDHRMFKKQ
jgi:putative heme-binding domain-containing protein